MNRNETIPLPPVPMSVFYRGRRKAKCNSFRKAVVSTAKLERQRYRRQRKP